MILIIRNILTNKETQIPLRTVEDFEPIFDLYPRSLDVALRSDSIQDAACNIAKYIDGNSRLTAYLSSGIQKNEEETPSEEKEVKIDLNNFNVNSWIEKRLKGRNPTLRDTSFVQDPGRRRDDRLDKPTPVTTMDKIKAKIEEIKTEDRRDKK